MKNTAPTYQIFLDLYTSPHLSIVSGFLLGGGSALPPPYGVVFISSGLSLITR